MRASSWVNARENIHLSRFPCHALSKPNIRRCTFYLAQTLSSIHVLVMLERTTSNKRDAFYLSLAKCNWLRSMQCKGEHQMEAKQQTVSKVRTIDWSRNKREYYRYVLVVVAHEIALSIGSSLGVTANIRTNEIPLRTSENQTKISCSSACYSPIQTSLDWKDDPWPDKIRVIMLT